MGYNFGLDGSTENKNTNPRYTFGLGVNPPAPHIVDDPRFNPIPASIYDSSNQFTPQMLSSHAPTFTPLPQAQPTVLQKLGKGLTDSITGGIGYKLGAAIKNGDFRAPVPYLPDYQPQTFGDKALELIGSNIGDAGLWMAGDAALAKPLGALAKTAPVAKGIGILPKTLAPALGTGARVGATYAGAIAPLESLTNGDNLNQFLQREKQTPTMALGGVALHGAGQLVGKGIGEAGNALLERKLKYPVLESNPLRDVQNAYKTPSLNEIRQQEYNQLFSGPDTQFKPAAMQAENPSQYFGNTTQADIEAAFGGPLSNFKIKNVITPEQKAHNLRQQVLEQVFSNQDQPYKPSLLGTNEPSQYFAKTQGDLESAFQPREFKTYKLTGEQKAIDELQQGIEAAQNYIQHNDVLAKYPPGTTVEQAYADVKANTGIDIPKLVANLERVQQGGPSLSPETRRLGRVAGALPDLKPRDTLSIPQPQLPQPNPKPLGFSPFGELPIDKVKPTLPDVRLKPREIQQVVPKLEQPRLVPPNPGPRQWTNEAQIKNPFNPFDVPKPKIELPNPTKGITPKIGLPKPTQNKVVAANIGESGRLGISAETEINNLIKNSDQWKDKNPMSLQRETWDRNITDIAGPQEGQKVREAIFDPIHVNEADRTRWINAEQGKIKSLKLSNKESEIVQRVGEGKIRVDEIPQGMDRAKILNATQAFRDFYDQAIEMANQALGKNGYKTVGKLKDYFPHFTGDDPLMKALGIKLDLVDLPTDINGLTHQFKPGKNWFGNFLHRTGDQTTFDAVQGFDRYIQGISKVIFHTDDIQRLRSFNRALRMKYSPAEIQTQVSEIMGNKELSREAKDAAVEDLLGRDSAHLSNAVADLEEFTNVLAGKKDLADRADERRFGRQIYNIASFIENRIGKNMVSINPASWITNFIPITQSLATTDKIATARAFTETMKNLVQNDGFINRSNFLTNRVGTDLLSKGMLDKTGDALSAPMRWVDNFASQVVTRSKYLEGIKRGMRPELAMKRADEWAAKILGDRSLGAMPTIFNQRSPLTRLFTQFQLEVNNQLSFMLKDMPHEYLKDGKTVQNVARLSSAVGQMLVYSWLYNNMYEKATGRRPAIDPIGLALGLKKDMGNPNIDTNKAVGDLATNVTQQIPFVGGVIGGGRIPISSALKPLTNLPSNILDMATNPAGPKEGGIEALKNLGSSSMYALMPFGGSQLKKSFQAYADLKGGGEYQGNQLKFPVSPTPSNIAKGYLFGPSSFTEAQNYYDNNLRPLSEKQTQKIINSPNIARDYNRLMQERRLSTLGDKIKSTQKDQKMDEDKKQKLIEFLRQEQAKVKGWGN